MSKRPANPAMVKAEGWRKTEEGGEEKEGRVEERGKQKKKRRNETKGD